jgi:transglutaminase-like putative cysteine protease
MKYILYHVTHTTEYVYAGPVSVSHHLMRLAPRQTPRQQCFEYTLTLDPSDARCASHGDYFGNTTHFMTVESTHGRLAVISRSRVGVALAFLPSPDETPAWETVRGRCMADHSGGVLEAHEFTYPSPLIAQDPAIADYAAASFPGERPVLDAVTDLTRRMHRDFKFDATATTVTTPVAEFFRYRRGVCQDFAHFQIACLRSMGLPARYVSGYLETDPPPGHPKLRGADASHAWASFFCPGLGWLDVDPTNNCLPSLRHITIGWGRDYADVCPVRGVLVGGHDQKLRISVDVQAVGTWDSGADGVGL